MLLEMCISNLILIEELRMQFSDGLIVLSGETGAGKSIIIDALCLLMGERVRYDDIRDNSKKAVVEAVFDIGGNEAVIRYLQEQGLLEDEETLLVSRDIFPQGRNVARVNGRVVTVSTLKIIGSQLIDLHGQDDRQETIHPAMYQQYVDSFVPEASVYLKEINDCYIAWENRRKQLEELKEMVGLREQKLDFLSFQINEIENSHLYPGEDKELDNLRERIKNVQQLLSGSINISASLYDSEETVVACDQVYEALEQAKSLDFDSFFSELVQPLEEIYYRLQDLSEKVISYRDKLDFEPGLLEETEDRLYEIARLKKKYGESIEAILSFLEAAIREHEELEQVEEKQEELIKDIDKAESAYMHIAQQMSEKRCSGAKILEERVHNELLDLNMPHLQFKVEIGEGKTPGPTGMDEVHFLFSPNPGEELRPLARIASGGEISRFILALKKALSDVYQVPTLIFDEIDVGLGGSALNAMAKKIASLSESHQLIIITHSPQISCYSKQHFVIEKQVKQQKTYTLVHRLQPEEQVKEIARMLDGDNYSQMALNHAREMLSKAQNNEDFVEGQGLSLFDD
ncbi:MAG: DNA repair protein RecN [Bacillota bacterium]|nr:DNA repair protein RecN [Bacillota bacterium]